MKKLIKTPPESDPPIVSMEEYTEFEETYESNFIAIKVVRGPSAGAIYLLTSTYGDKHMFSNGKSIFICGNNRNKVISAALDYEILDVFIFDSICDLAKWITKGGN